MEAGKNMEAQEVIKSREGTPKMLQTVIKVIDPESRIHDYFNPKYQALSNIDQYITCPQ